MSRGAGSRLSTIVYRDQPWIEDGVCRTVDPGVFHSKSEVARRAAKQYCAECPVCEQCLRYSIENREPFGVWGGLDERERKALLRGVPVPRRGRPPKR